MPGGATGSLFRQKQILYYCAFLHEDSYPKKLTRCNWSNPLYPAGMAALFCVLSLIAYRISFTAQNDPPAIWELIASIIIPFVIFIGLGSFVFISKTNEAHEDMEYEWKR